MNVKKIAFFLAIVLCLIWPLTVIPMVKAQAVTGGEATYRRKVISVVYDNSGSMGSQSRIHYAQYSLQILLSMLNENDTMIINPMNVKNTKDQAIVVELKNGDCSEAIREIVNRDAIKTANGGTPFDAVKRAVKQLTERGLKTVEQAGDAENDEDYWLVVLTDGEFASISSSSALEEALRQQITPYSSLQTIYLGIGKDAADLSGCGLTTSAPFHALKAGEKNLFVEEMQTICNLMSGRYSLPQDYYTISGNTLSLDLDKADFPFRTLSVLLQDCAAKLVSARYGGNTITPAKYGTMAGNSYVNMADGFFAGFEGAPYFSGGKLELTFSSPVDVQKLTFMGEPALRISPYYEYQSATGWQRADMRYINSNLTPQDSIRVGYEVYELAHGNRLDLDQIFGDVRSRVTYAGKSYATNVPIQLVAGTNEIGVTVSVMNGVYSINTSAVCIISENPTYYRIEAQAVEQKIGSDSKMVADFVIYADNKPLTKAALADYSVELHVYREDGTELQTNVSWAADGKITAEADLNSLAIGEKCRAKLYVLSPLNVAREKTVEVVVTANVNDIGLSVEGDSTLCLTQAALLDNRAGLRFAVDINGVRGDFADAKRIAYCVTLNGRDITSHTTVQDGILTYVPSFENMGSEAGTGGKKTVKVAVWSAMDSNLRREAEAELEIVKSTLTLTVTPGDGSFSITPFKLKGNTRGFTYQLTLDGRPVDPAGGLIDLSITVDGRDVSDAVTVQEGGLFYAPTDQELNGLTAVGKRTITARAAIRRAPELSASCETSMSIVDSQWELRLLDADQRKIDRFAIQSSGAFVELMVLCDGDFLGRDEIERLWQEGHLTAYGADLDKSFFLPMGSQVTFEERDGAGVLRYAVTRDHLLPIAGVTAMFISDGEKGLHVSCHGATLDAAFECPSSLFLSYAWRIAIILLILYFILFLILGTQCRSFSPGRYVVVTIRARTVNVNVTNVNLSLWQKYGWHLRRLIPWHLIMDQPDIDGAAITFEETRKPGGPHFVEINSNDYVKLQSRGVTPQAWTNLCNELSRPGEVSEAFTIQVEPDVLRRAFQSGNKAGDRPVVQPSVKYGRFRRGGELQNIIFYVTVNQ